MTAASGHRSPSAPTDAQGDLRLEGASSLATSYQRLLGTTYPLSVSPNLISKDQPAYFPYSPAAATRPDSVSPSSAFLPLPALPDHSGLLSGAVESALWTGDLPSLGVGGGGRGDPLPSPLPAFPSPSSSSSRELGTTNPFLSSTWTIGQTLAAFPSAAGTSSSLPAAGTLAARRGSAGGFESDHVVGSPVGVQSRVKPFIQKLSHLLSRPDAYADCFSWDASGKAFIIHHCKRLHNEILPRMFSHSNTASLTRQLNVYGFRRLTNSELTARIDVPNTNGYSGWVHPGFIKGDKASLHLLVPRPSKARQAKKKERELAGEEETRGRTRRASNGSRTSGEDGEEGEEEQGEETGFEAEVRRASEASSSSDSSSFLQTPTTPNAMAYFAPPYPGGGTFAYLDPSLVGGK
ncbi:hypothetical protein JCM11251_002591 [Rhodosporidiobolus azoricus]